jgi:hypothetical protein
MEEDLPSAPSVIVISFCAGDGRAISDVASDTKYKRHWAAHLDDAQNRVRPLIKFALCSLA